MYEPTNMENFENYISIDTNGKNLEQCTDIPPKRNKILKLLQCGYFNFSFIFTIQKSEIQFYAECETLDYALVELMKNSKG